MVEVSTSTTTPRKQLLPGEEVGDVGAWHFGRPVGPMRTPNSVLTPPRTGLYTTK